MGCNHCGCTFLNAATPPIKLYTPIKEEGILPPIKLIIKMLTVTEMDDGDKMWNRPGQIHYFTLFY